MLLDYAAHIKCRTQHRVLSTAVSLSHLPSDVHQFILSFSSTAQQLLQSLHAELVAITSRSQARQRVKRRLDRTQQQLDKVTRLIQQGNQVMESVRDDDADAALNTREAEDDAAAGDESRAGSAATLSPPPPSVDLDLLTEQIRQLKEQMEMFAKLQQTAAAGAGSDSAAGSSDGEDDADSAAEPPMAALLDVPIAPPLITIGHHKSSDSMSFACIPIASPMLHSEIPIAPPLLPAPAAAAAATASVPIAPPLILLPSNSAAVIPAAPPIISVTAPVDAAIAAVIAPVAAAAPASGLPAARPSRAILCPLPPSAVYTRNIPGSESLSHTDLIRVAARIKLRRTNVPRSPGGTPCKSALRADGIGAGSVIGLGDALRLKFRNAHSHSQRQQLRTQDKENENWEDE